jgi:hypothetical protein
MGGDVRESAYQAFGQQVLADDGVALDLLAHAVDVQAQQYVAASARARH